MSHDTPGKNSTADSVRSSIIGAASQVDIGMPGDALTEVRATANGRRRRRNAMVGVAAAGALVAGGVVVANVVTDGNDGDDFIVSSPVTDPSDEADDADESTEEPSPDNDTAPADDAGSGGVEATPAPAGGTETVAAEAQVIAPAESFVGSFQQVFPWKDGFITIGQTQPQQALPDELPDEISAAFPDEVIQFFDDAGGLPPTIDEAIEMLNEAGLFDVVSEVVLNNPEVSEAIYATPVEPPVQFARLSMDGIEWTDIDLQVPGDDFALQGVVSTGDRLVAVETEYRQVDEEPEGGEPVPSPYREPDVLGINVHTTTDLQTWTTQRIDLAGVDTDLPDYIQRGSFVNDVAVNATGWALGVESYQSVDYEALLPDDFDRSFLTSDFGYGLYHDDAGIVVETYDEQGFSEQVRIPWSDLGLTEAPVGLAGDSFLDSGGATIWASDWNGTPVESVSTGPYFGQISGFDGGFVRQGDRMSFSPDGVTWTDFDGPESQGWVNATVAVPGGLLAFASGPDGGVQPYRLDVDALTWERVADPVLPDGFSPWHGQSNGAILYTIEDFSQYSSVEDFPLDPFEIAVVNDDYTLDVRIDGQEQSYTLTDNVTGEIVVSESAVADLDDDIPFEFVTEVDDFIEVTSPDTGEILTTFTPEQLAAGVGDASVGDAPAVTAVPASEVVIAEGEIPPTPEFDPEYVEPELNVLATNGEVWINQSLDIAQPEAADPMFGPANYPQNAAVNNDIVLVSMSDGSFIRFTF